MCMLPLIAFVREHIWHTALFMGYLMRVELTRVCSLVRIITKLWDCGLEVSEFEHQLSYYVYFRSNTTWKGMKPLIPASYGLNSTYIVLQQEWFWL